MVEARDIRVKETPDEAKKRIIDSVSRNTGKLFSPIGDFKEFDSLNISNKVLVGEIGFSGHGTYFFEFTYKNELDKIQTKNVAVKSLGAQEIQCETAAYTRFNQLSPCFSPLEVAFYVDNGEDSYLSTIVKPNLRTVESLLQTVFRESPTKESLLKNYEFFVSQGIIGFLSAHRCGILHKDAFPKNVGINMENNQIVPFDFELSHTTRRPSEAISMQESLQEIEVQFLNRCLVIAVTLSDTLMIRIEDEVRQNHKKRLEMLGINDPSVFMEIKQRLIKKTRELYESDVFLEAGWTKEIEKEVYFKFHNRYPSSSGIYTEEFIEDLIQKGKDLRMSFKLPRKSA